MSLYAFAFGQVAFALTILVGYYGYFFLNGTKASEKLKLFLQLFPSLISGVDSGLLGMVRTFLVQSLEKLVLQEGEKIVLRGVASLVNQGVFGVVNGLGSLVTRILFQPIEEGAYPMFNKLLHNQDETAAKKKNDDTALEDEKSRMHEARSILVRLLRILTLLGTTRCCLECL
jgi:oligosaccharide translocation protein RFT1